MMNISIDKKTYKSLFIQQLSLYLEKMLAMHLNTTPCWYHIQNIKNDGCDCNLSSYLGLGDNSYEMVLLFLGLGRERKGSAKLTIKEDDWRKFLILHELQDHIEVTTKFDCEQSSIRNLKWLRLGQKPFSAEDKYTATE